MFPKYDIGIMLIIIDATIKIAKKKFNFKDINSKYVQNMVNTKQNEVIVGDEDE